MNSQDIDLASSIRLVWLNGARMARGWFPTSSTKFQSRVFRCKKYILHKTDWGRHLFSRTFVEKIKWEKISKRIQKMSVSVISFFDYATDFWTTHQIKTRWFDAMKSQSQWFSTDYTHTRVFPIYLKLSFSDKTNIYHVVTFEEKTRGHDPPQPIFWSFSSEISIMVRAFN